MNTEKNPSAGIKAENRYITNQYGLASSLPLFEAKDGFRMRSPWRDAEYLISQGWKLAVNQRHQTVTGDNS